MGDYYEPRGYLQEEGRDGLSDAVILQMLRCYAAAIRLNAAARDRSQFRMASATSRIMHVLRDGPLLNEKAISDLEDEYDRG